MASKLELLLEQIDPSRTINANEKLINEAAARYYRGNNNVDSFDDIKPCLAEIFRALENAVLQLGDNYEMNASFDSSRALYLLNREYGSEQTVYNIMLSGAEGGINRILKTLARLLAENYSDNEINARVNDYLSSLSVDEQLAATDEYLNKYQDLLPQAIREEPYRIKPQFRQVLVDHPRMLKRYRNW